ncbi:DUF2332 family protein [Sinorhizobium medicae]|nr:DUF2332 family protein [Sinorhizobium medicae]MDX1244416.1 DUF2332 family protein [Sinorhizobium medicae]
MPIVLAEIMLSHTTQTNEPGRCASLFPALARIDVEVGIAAGLWVAAPNSVGRRCSAVVRKEKRTDEGQSGKLVWFSRMSRFLVRPHDELQQRRNWPS